MPDDVNIAEPDAGPNDEERDQPRVPCWTPLARSTSSVSFLFGDQKRMSSGG
jgi:hypothetical protein